MVIIVIYSDSDKTVLTDFNGRFSCVGIMFKSNMFNVAVCQDMQRIVAFDDKLYFVPLLGVK